MTKSNHHAYQVAVKWATKLALLPESATNDNLARIAYRFLIDMRSGFDTVPSRSSIWQTSFLFKAGLLHARPRSWPVIPTTSISEIYLAFLASFTSQRCLQNRACYPSVPSANPLANNAVDMYIHAKVWPGSLVQLLSRPIWIHIVHDDTYPPGRSSPVNTALSTNLFKGH
nr:hypothetical protein CFP56_60254 [Quercus suber]